MNTKKCNKPNSGQNPDNLPNYSLPIPIAVFRRLFHEAYEEIVADFVDEKALKEKIARRVLETINDVLDNHVSRITRKHLNASDH